MNQLAFLCFLIERAFFLLLYSLLEPDVEAIYQAYNIDCDRREDESWHNFV